MDKIKIEKGDLTGTWKNEHDNPLTNKDKNEITFLFGDKKTNGIIIKENKQETSNSFDDYNVKELRNGKFTITLQNYKQEDGKDYTVNCSQFFSGKPTSFVARITKYGERTFVKQT